MSRTPGTAVVHVGGEVIAPRDFDFTALRALPQQLVESSALLAGREIGAIPLTALLAATGAHPGAQGLLLESDDGTFATALPIEAAAACLIVYRVGEAPLPRGLGGPFRLVTHGRLRAGDVKALGAIYVSERRFVDVDDTERVVVRVTRAA